MPLWHCAFEDMLTQKEVGLQSLWRRLRGWIFLSNWCGFIRASKSVMKTNSILWWMILCLCVCVCVYFIWRYHSKLWVQGIYAHIKFQLEGVRCKRISLADIFYKLSICSKNLIMGLGRWHRGSRQLLLLQRSHVWFPAPPWWHITICNQFQYSGI